MSDYDNYGYGVFCLKRAEKKHPSRGEQHACHNPYQSWSIYGKIQPNQRENHKRQRANYQEQRKMLTLMHNEAIVTFGEDKFAILQNDYSVLPEHQMWELHEALYQYYVKPKYYGAVNEAMTVKMNVKWDPTTPFGTLL